MRPCLGEPVRPCLGEPMSVNTQYLRAETALVRVLTAILAATFECVNGAIGLDWEFFLLWQTEVAITE